MVEPPVLRRRHVADTSVWIWTRDRRHPQLLPWFDEMVRAGRIATVGPVVLELVRGAPSPEAARRSAERLAALPAVVVPPAAWGHAAQVQLRLARDGDHRRVPVPDLLIAAACELAEAPLLHVDADFERIAAVSGLEQRWLAAPDALAAG